MTREIIDCLTPSVEETAEAEQTQLEQSESIEATGESEGGTDPIAAHVESLIQQAEELRREIRGFDLAELIKDEEFVRMTAPESGISLRRAYFALEAERAHAEAAKRPREGGGRTAAAIASMSPARMDKAQRAELKQRIMSAAARGEKIYP